MTATEIDLNATVWPVVYVREWVLEKYGIASQTWYYHSARCAQPSVTMGAWTWYTTDEFEEVKAYFAKKYGGRCGRGRTATV
jgi:hypothetical protein